MRILISTVTWFGASVEHVLRGAGFLVTPAYDGAETLACLDCVGRAAVLLETDLPDRDWRTVFQQIRDRDPSLPILAICPDAKLEFEIKVLSQGADEVIAPRMSEAEMIARVLSVSARRAGYPSAILRLGALTIDTAAQRVFWASHEVELTASQYHILEHLALHQDRVVERDELLDLLYGIDDTPDTHVLSVFLCNLRKKLHQAGAPDHTINSVYGRGVCLANFERRELGRPEGRDWFTMLQKIA